MLMKEQGLPLVKPALCRVGGHVFLTFGWFLRIDLDSNPRCDCGLYAFKELSKELFPDNDWIIVKERQADE